MLCLGINYALRVEAAQTLALTRSSRPPRKAWTSFRPSSARTNVSQAPDSAGNARQPSPGHYVRRTIAEYQFLYIFRVSFNDFLSISLIAFTQRTGTIKRGYPPGHGSATDIPGGHVIFLVSFKMHQILINCPRVISTPCYRGTDVSKREITQK